MKKDQCIIINALQFSGSSILWNIVSSHPDVLNPGRETGEILDALQRTGRLMRSERRNKPVWKECLGKLFKLHVNNLKYASLKNEDQNDKYPGQKYTAKEIKDTTVCIKSVNVDFQLNDFIARQFQKTYVIGLVRNGYAFCDGMERRGRKTQETCQLYSRFSKFILEQNESGQRFILIRFEDVLSDPFAVASEIFEFLELDPVNLEHLRLKSKRILRQDGSHKVPGDKTEGVHYWYDRQEIMSFLDGGINDVQFTSLKEESRAIFASTCGEDLEKMGY